MPGKSLLPTAAARLPREPVVNVTAWLTERDLDDRVGMLPATSDSDAGYRL
jgi:hypothetical protein